MFIFNLLKLRQIESQLRQLFVFFEVNTNLDDCANRNLPRAGGVVVFAARVRRIKNKDSLFSQFIDTRRTTAANNLGTHKPFNIGPSRMERLNATP